MGRRRIPQRTAREVGELYLAEASGLFIRARMLTQGDRAGAEDLVQKVFEAAALKWSELRCRCDEDRRKWLFTALRNKAIDEWRATRWTVVHPEQVVRESEARPRSRPDPCDVAVEAVDQERLWKELKIMPPARYRVAYLTWVLDWSPKQIAERYGISESTVRVHKSEAVKQLRSMGLALRESDEGEDLDGKGEPGWWAG